MISENSQTQRDLQDTPPKKKKRVFSYLKETAATFSLIWLLVSCDGNFPNKEVIVNPSEKYIKFNVEYQLSESLVENNVVVRKYRNKYYWDIVKSDWRSKEKEWIESNNLDWVLNEISRSLNHEQVTDTTIYKKDAKISFVRQVFKDSIENNKNPSKWEFRIKYNPK